MTALFWFVVFVLVGILSTGPSKSIDRYAKERVRK